MSKISKAAKRIHTDKVEHVDERVTNFMGGTSYKVNPLETLKLVAASSIFGEPQYYHTKGMKDGVYKRNTAGCHTSDCIIDETYVDKSTSEIFEDVIDKALDYDFDGTLHFAMTLRNEYYMRLNPQIIMVRAAMHPKRQEYTNEHPGVFNLIQQNVMLRADEPSVQCAYYMYKNEGDKNGMPSILKRSIAKKLSSLTPYQVNKYKNAEIGMINAVRITHATSPVLNELMKTGTIEVPEENATWEQLRSSGKSWRQIVELDCMPHMAMLRNIHNVFREIDNIDICKKYMEKLKSGVLKGKQFPFRYESAYKVINASSTVYHKIIILDALEECIDISIENLPKLKGKTMCLSDNSGSAWGEFESEFGTETVAEIDNLSSVIASMCSDEGYVGKFGDRLIEYPITKRNGALSQSKHISDGRGYDVGRSTEGGIWKFFKKAIEEKIWYDNIFIFSDQQAGTGGLYGDDEDIAEYMDLYGLHKFSPWPRIDVYKLTLQYRNLVNPKVNIFSVQTAGYKNSIIPMMSYRCALLYGWTGKEVLFAKKYIDEWDKIDNARMQKQEPQSKNDIPVNDKPWFLNDDEED